MGLTAMLPPWQQWGMDQRPLKILTDYRTQRDWTCSDLAKFLGEGRSNVHRWESGSRKIGRTKLDLVAEKTGIPKRDLRPDLAEVMREAAE